VAGGTLGVGKSVGARAMLNVRFKGDSESASAILDDAALAPLLLRAREHAPRGSARKDLLANAVRVDNEMLPDLAQATDKLRQRADLNNGFECFVYQSAMIEAGVLKTPQRLIVLLSSATVEKLTEPELRFVIGHEVGHVVYEHFNIPVRYVLENEHNLAPRDAIRLLSWRRKAEVSADRVGLVCCGSLDVAASAFFKSLSGLSIPRLKVNPLQFAAQFDHLRDEIWREGSEEMGLLTHPLSPLRMKSLITFWNSDPARRLLPDAPGGMSADACEREIAGMLAFMDPMSERAGAPFDPMLLPFLIWGGLYTAASNGLIEESELSALSSVVGKAALSEALLEKRSINHYRQCFADAVKGRRRPLSALDINRVFTVLVSVVRADGSVEAQEVEALRHLAGLLKVAPSYVDRVLGQFDEQG
jgi:hypothetical protein